jgi:lysophospholipase
MDSTPPVELEQVIVDGMRVRLGHLPPPPAGGQGSVIVLPGRAEFIEKYGETLAALQSWGFAAAILDWRGQGGSDRFLAHRHRGHVIEVEDYLADLDAMIARVEQLRLPQPFVMLSHSMGGHIGLRYLHAHADRFAGSVMIAPMFGIRLTPTPEPLARALCAAAVRLGGSSRFALGQRDFALERYVFAGNRLTSSPERYAELRRHVAATPELALGGVTYGWLAAALRSIALTRRPGYLEGIRTPILICQAGTELIVSNRAQVETVRRLPNGKLLAFPGARHELLFERDAIRDRVLAAFRSFTAEVTRGPEQARPPPASGPSGPSPRRTSSR